MKKICSSCRKTKLTDLFSKCARNKDGLMYWCKKCVSQNRNREISRLYYVKNKERQRAYYKANKIEIAKKVKARHDKDPERVIDIRLRSWYGTSKIEYDQMHKKQRGTCKICKTKTKLVVDHDHQTNIVRGLLCSLCNKGLGLFRENKKSLKSAVNYLNGK